MHFPATTSTMLLTLMAIFGLLTPALSAAIPRTIQLANPDNGNRNIDPSLLSSNTQSNRLSSDYIPSNRDDNNFNRNDNQSNRDENQSNRIDVESNRVPSYSTPSNTNDLQSNRIDKQSNRDDNQSNRIDIESNRLQFEPTPSSNRNEIEPIPSNTNDFQSNRLEPESIQSNRIGMDSPSSNRNDIDFNTTNLQSRDGPSSADCGPSPFQQPCNKNDASSRRVGLGMLMVAVGAGLVVLV